MLGREEVQSDLLALESQGSVMHMNTEDLEDLRSLVTSRVKDAHVHICVDAQTGLGTGILGTGRRNIGTASASSWNTC